MHLECFAVWDSKAMAYLPPFFIPNAAMALRVFTDCVNDRGHQWGKHPEDYTLFFVGRFDTLLGSFSQEKIDVVAAGVQVKAPGGSLAQLDIEDQLGRRS